MPPLPEEAKAKRNPHAAPARVHTQQIQEWIQMVGYVCIRTGKAKEENGKGTIVIKPDETKEFNCALNGGHTTTFSAR